MSQREIRQKFTKSELAALGWRSTEVAYNMEAMRPEQHQSLANVNTAPSRYVPPVYTDEEITALEARMGPVVHKVANMEDGSVDLAKLTGDEAVRYMTAMGLPMAGRT